MKNDRDKLKGIFKELKGSNTIQKERDNLKIDTSLDNYNSLIVKGLNAIILQAINLKASDIHIEPLRNITRVRYRVDGVLILGENISSSLHSALISRLKIISQLDITEKRIPQDGKFRMKIEDNFIDFRVSIVPLITGEKAVIRILDQSSLNLTLENIGFSSNEYEQILKLINKKNGIILASGPTGSGKSSLIYSILKKLNTSEINISTIEDPVEYEIAEINQVQYNNEVGRNFSTILKAYLRQDPDIIMFGEIRDLETAEIAIKAALTGHLILSTIHTNDSISGIFRLLNIGVPSYMISASVIGIIAQRLVRKLCPHCKILDTKWQAKMTALKVDFSKYINENFYTSLGCEKCNYTGFNGRTAIFELFILDSEIRALIDKNATIEEIRKVTENNGMLTLIDAGVQKSIAGITSLDEILRQV